VTVAVAGVNWFTHDYAPRYDFNGDPIPLNGGMVGVAMDRSRGRVDNFTVQILPPEWTLDETDNFSSVAELPREDQTSGWLETSKVLTGTAGATAPAVQTVDLGTRLKPSSILEMEVDIKTGGTAGFIFDRYDTDNYKYIALDAANDQIVVGYSTTGGGRVVSNTYAVDLNANKGNRLQVTMQGAGLAIKIDGAIVTNYGGYNAVLVDGDFGIAVFEGTATFDDFRVATNDDAFSDAMKLSSESLSYVTSDAAEVTEAEVQNLYSAALEDWAQSGLVTEAQLATLSGVTLLVTDLEGVTLARANKDGTIFIDATAAGVGWYADKTPDDDSDDNANGVDLLSVLRHEIGHLLGIDHGETEWMEPTIAAGVRLVPVSDEEQQQALGAFPLDEARVTPVVAPPAELTARDVIANSSIVIPQVLQHQVKQMVMHYPDGLAIADVPHAGQAGAAGSAMRMHAGIMMFDEASDGFVTPGSKTSEAKRPETDDWDWIVNRDELLVDKDTHTKPGRLIDWFNRARDSVGLFGSDERGSAGLDDD
jgi:hypothetical protein